LSIRPHGVLLEPIRDEEKLTQKGFRIARMMNENFPTIVEHIQALMGEFQEARACRIYLRSKNEAGVAGAKLEPRLSVEKITSEDIFRTCEEWDSDPWEASVIEQSFRDHKPIVIDFERRLKVVFENLDMDNHNCDIFPLEADAAGSTNHLAAMPLYYRDKENLLGIAVFDGVKSGENQQGEFGRTFWTATTAIAAASQISFALVARFDPVTGLPSKQDFDVDHKAAIRRLVRGELFGLNLILIDLDDFKLVNDRYSYRIGNKVLREAARIIKSSVRDEDMVSRWGGEEFAVVLPGISTADSCMIAGRINSRIREAAIETKKGRVNVTCSVGVLDVSDIAIWVSGKNGDTEDDEMRWIERISKGAFDTVDGLLKAAKRSGKDTVFYNEQGMAKRFS